MELRAPERRYTLDQFEEVLPEGAAEEWDAIIGGEAGTNPLTVQQVREALSYLPPEGWDYQKGYLPILMAVAANFPGDPETTTMLVREWSPVLDKATGRDKTAETVRSFRREGVTVATLIARAQAHGWAGPKKELRLVGHGVKPGTVQRKKAEEGSTGVGTDAQYEDTSLDLSTVQPEEVRWLWAGRVAYGKLTIIDGDPGQGKSSITLDLAAHLSRGVALPGEDAAQEAGVSIVINPEDAAADTLVPRLIAARADRSKVKALTEVPDGRGGTRPFRLPEDVPYLEWLVRKHDAKLVVLDPLMSVLGPEVNSFSDQDVRAALTPLGLMAQRTGAAVMLVRHLNKARGGSALHRGGGSIGIIGVARSGLLVGADPEGEGRYVLAQTKNNLAAHAPSLAYRIVTAENGAGRVEWLGESNVTADRLVSPVDDRQRTKQEEAEAWLEAALEDGCADATALRAEAEKVGIGYHTLNRARKKLRIAAEKEADGLGSHRSCWCWPTAAAA